MDIDLKKDLKSLTRWKWWN